jgi:site-specific recombinase XerC
MRLPRSMSASRQFAGWRTRHQIAFFSARIGRYPPRERSPATRRSCRKLAICRTGKTLIAAPLGLQPHKVRDKAVLSMPIGSGLRRAELVKVRIEDFNFGRIDGSWWTSSPKAVTYERYRYRPWVKFTVDAWVNAANSQNGTLFQAIGKTGKVWVPALPRR